MTTCSTVAAAFDAAATAAPAPATTSTAENCYYPFRFVGL